MEPRTSTSRIRWLGHVERSTAWIAEVSKVNVVAQKRRSRPTKICDEVLVDDRMKLIFYFWSFEISRNILRNQKILYVSIHIF